MSKVEEVDLSELEEISLDDLEEVSGSSEIDINDLEEISLDGLEEIDTPSTEERAISDQDHRDQHRAKVKALAKEQGIGQDEESITAKDIGAATMAGSAGMAETIGYGVEAAGDYFGSETVLDAGTWIKDLGRESKEYWNSAKSPQALESEKKKFIVPREDGSMNYEKTFLNIVKNPGKIGLSVGESLSATGMGMATGGFLAKSFQLIPKVGQGIAGAMGYGLGEGAISATGGAKDTEEKVMKMTHKQLSTHPEYRSALIATDGDKGTAKAMVARAAAGDAAALNMLTTTLLSSPMGYAFSPIFANKGNIADNFLDSLAIGIAGETAQEATQSGAETAGQNKAVLNRADITQEVGEGVPEAMIAGGLAGGAMGGGIATGAEVYTKYDQKKQTNIRQEAMRKYANGFEWTSLNPEQQQLKQQLKGMEFTSLNEEQRQTKEKLQSMFFSSLSPEQMQAVEAENQRVEGIQGRFRSLVSENEDVTFPAEILNDLDMQERILKEFDNLHATAEEALGHKEPTYTETLLEEKAQDKKEAAAVEEIDNFFKQEVNKKSEAAKNRSEEKRNRLEEEHGPDEDKINEAMKVPQKKKILPTEEQKYKGMDEVDLEELDAATETKTTKEETYTPKNKDIDYKILYDNMPTEKKKVVGTQKGLDLEGTQSQLFDTQSSEDYVTPAWAKNIVSDTTRYEDIIAAVTKAKNGEYSELADRAAAAFQKSVGEKKTPSTQNKKTALIETEAPPKSEDKGLNESEQYELSKLKEAEDEGELSTDDQMRLEDLESIQAAAEKVTAKKKAEKTLFNLEKKIAKLKKEHDAEQNKNTKIGIGNKIFDEKLKLKSERVRLREVLGVEDEYTTFRRATVLKKDLPELKRKRKLQKLGQFTYMRKNQKIRKEAAAKGDQRSWRKKFEDAKEFMDRADILRAVADNAKTDKDLNAVLDRVEAAEHNNITWAVIRNPHAGVKTSQRAQAMYDAGPTKEAGDKAEAEAIAEEVAATGTHTFDHGSSLHEIDKAGEITLIKKDGSRTTVKPGKYKDMLIKKHSTRDNFETVNGSKIYKFKPLDHQYETAKKIHNKLGVNSKGEIIYETKAETPMRVILRDGTAHMNRNKNPLTWAEEFEVVGPVEEEETLEDKSNKRIKSEYGEEWEKAPLDVKQKYEYYNSQDDKVMNGIIDKINKGETSHEYKLDSQFVLIRKPKKEAATNKDDLPGLDEKQKAFYKKIKAQKTPKLADRNALMDIETILLQHTRENPYKNEHEERRAKEWDSLPTETKKEIVEKIKKETRSTFMRKFQDNWYESDFMQLSPQIRGDLWGKMGTRINAAIYDAQTKEQKQQIYKDRFANSGFEEWRLKEELGKAPIDKKYADLTEDQRMDLTEWFMNDALYEDYFNNKNKPKESVKERIQRRAKDLKEKEQPRSKAFKQEDPKEKEVDAAAKEIQERAGTPLEGIENDITLKEAIASRAGISHSPEQRGASIVKSYIEGMVETYNDLKQHATTEEQKEILDTMFTDYRKGMVKRKKLMLARDSRVMSTMITGPANFPVRSNQKKQDSAHNALEDLVNYDTFMTNKIRNKLTGNEVVKSTDEDAVEKLEEKLAQLEKNQEQMKAANKILRSKKWTDEKKIEQLVSVGFSEKVAAELLSPDVMGTIGYASFSLTNNNAKIKSTKARIEQIKKLKEKAEEIGEEEKEYSWGTLKQDFEDQRIRFIFDGKPAAEIITILKKNGFRWSPKNGAWQRQITPNAQYKTKVILKQLEELTQPKEAEKKVWRADLAKLTDSKDDIYVKGFIAKDNINEIGENEKGETIYENDSTGQRYIRRGNDLHGTATPNIKEKNLPIDLVVVKKDEGQALNFFNEVEDNGLHEWEKMFIDPFVKRIRKESKVIDEFIGNKAVHTLLKMGSTYHYKPGAHKVVIGNVEKYSRRDIIIAIEHEIAHFKTMGFIAENPNERRLHYINSAVAYMKKHQDEILGKLPEESRKRVNYILTRTDGTRRTAEAIAVLGAEKSVARDLYVILGKEKPKLSDMIADVIRSIRRFIVGKKTIAALAKKDINAAKLAAAVKEVIEEGHKFNEEQPKDALNARGKVIANLTEQKGQKEKSRFNFGDISDPREHFKQIGKDLGLHTFDVFKISDNELKLNLLIVGDKKQGKGTAAVEELIKYADKNKMRVTLSPGLKDDNFGTTSRSRLIKFYKRFGFVENKGRNKDFSISDGMYREPKGKMRPAFINLGTIASTPFQITELINKGKNKLDNIVFKTVTGKVKNTKFDTFMRKYAGGSMAGLGNLTRAQEEDFVKHFRELEAKLSKADISAEEKAALIEESMTGTNQDLFNTLSIQYLENPEAREGIAEEYPELAASLDVVREYIDKISLESMERGIILPSQHAKWEGRYLSRLYLATQKPEIAASVSSGIKMYENKNNRKIESIVDYLMENPEEAERLGAVLDPSLMIKTTIAKTQGNLGIEEFFRGITERSHIVDQSMLISLSDRVANLPMMFSPKYAENTAVPYINDMINRLDEDLDAADINFLIDRLEEIEEQIAGAKDAILNNSEKLDQIPDDKRYGAIAGLPMEIGTASLVKSQFHVVSDPKMFKEKVDHAGKKLLVYFKWAKVPANIFAYPRNFQSNFFQWSMSGADPFQFFTRYGAAAHSMVTKDKWYQMALENGVLQTNMISLEVNDALREIAKATPADSKVKQKTLKAMEKVGNAYGVIDDVAKIARMRYAIENEGMDVKDAVNKAQDTHYDYSLTYDLVRGMRDPDMTKGAWLKLLGTLFPTYTHKTIAYVYDTIIHRPVTLAMIGASLAMLVGGNDEDREKIGAKRYDKIMADMPEWMKGNPLIRVDMERRGSGVDVTFTDISYIVPFGSLLSAVYSTAHGDPVDALSTMGLAGTPVHMIGGLLTNTDSFSGKEIFYEHDSTEKYKDIGAYMGKQLLPGTITKLMSLSETKHPLGLRLIGINTYTYEAKELRRWKEYAAKRAKLDAKKRTFKYKRKISQARKDFKRGKISSKKYYDIREDSLAEIKRWQQIGRDAYKQKKNN